MTKSALILILYVAALYGTIPVAPKIFSLLQKTIGQPFSIIINGLLAAFTIILFFIVYKRVVYRRLAVCGSILIAVLAFAIAMKDFKLLLAEKIHILEYVALSYFVLNVVDPKRGQATFSTRKSSLSPFRYAAAFVVLALISYGDEFIQRFTPGRVYELRDVAVNLASAFLGLFLVLAIRYGSRD